ncbi:hypothetical protein ADUPG1_011866 [Aduncisulcus paluster]|uniref:Uncharacterized protein n=1 Tax=Aduncisulcus paluster TaxID=2918883 RepID=A0ABQ5JY87_9EUKA|nr:hypothetical protein ADUPG1_011866 [Aduncisulcus paluster]
MASIAKLESSIQATVSWDGEDVLTTVSVYANGKMEFKIGRTKHNIPIIANTTIHSLKGRRTCVVSGAKGLVFTPCTDDELVSLLSAIQMQKYEKRIAKQHVESTLASLNISHAKLQVGQEWEDVFIKIEGVQITFYERSGQIIHETDEGIVEKWRISAASEPIVSGSAGVLVKVHKKGIVEFDSSDEADLFVGTVLTQAESLRMEMSEKDREQLLASFSTPIHFSGMTGLSSATKVYILFAKMDMGLVRKKKNVQVYLDCDGLFEVRGIREYGGKQLVTTDRSDIREIFYRTVIPTLSVGDISELRDVPGQYIFGLKIGPKCPKIYFLNKDVRDMFVARAKIIRSALRCEKVSQEELQKYAPGLTVVYSTSIKGIELADETTKAKKTQFLKVIVHREEEKKEKKDKEKRRSMIFREEIFNYRFKLVSWATSSVLVLQHLLLRDTGIPIARQVLMHRGCEAISNFQSNSLYSLPRECTLDLYIAPPVPVSLSSLVVSRKIDDLRGEIKKIQHKMEKTHGAIAKISKEDRVSGLLSEMKTLLTKNKQAMSALQRSSLSLEEKAQLQKSVEEIDRSVKFYLDKLKKR